MSDSPLHVINSEPWYKNGLRFECTGCGACCTKEPGYVWVTEEEVVAIAEFLGLTIENFARKHLRIVDGMISLLEDPNTYDCTFLKNNKCQIYPVRPTQCRTFPWWDSNLTSAEAWNKAALRCEGINDDAPVVPLDVIEKNLAEET